MSKNRKDEDIKEASGFAAGGAVAGAGLAAVVGNMGLSVKLQKGFHYFTNLCLSASLKF